MLHQKISSFDDTTRIIPCTISGFRRNTKDFQTFSIMINISTTYSISSIFIPESFSNEYIIKLKNNLEEICNCFLFNVDDYLKAKPEESIFKPVKCKVVTLNNTIYALSNIEETKFILLNDKITNQKVISKQYLESTICTLLTSQAIDIFEEFSDDIKSLSEFLYKYKYYLSHISISDIEKIQKSVLQLNKLLN